MSNLLIKPLAAEGLCHAITPTSANWHYVGFDLHRLKAGDAVSGNTLDREVILVLVEGKAEISGGGVSFGVLGERMSVFEQIKPHCVYIPNGCDWNAIATTHCELAICSAPGHGNYPAARIENIGTETRGKGSNTRTIFPIAMEDKDVADSLLVTEVFTPAGNWSSYPPHRHDEDDYPRITYLEETYYFRMDPPQGYGIQRVFTEDGSLDETMAVSDGDVTLVPKGHHPCGSPHGYSMYYLNVMAGPMRKWRFINHPDHEWIVERDG